jgi:hypothetical protein
MENYKDLSYSAVTLLKLIKFKQVLNYFFLFSLKNLILTINDEKYYYLFIKFNKLKNL